MRHVPLILVGHGGVGKAFLAQIRTYAGRQAADPPIRFLKTAVVTSGRIVRHDGKDTERRPDDWDGVLDAAREAEMLWGARPVIIDATAAKGVPHLGWVEEGFTVVTANKLPLDAPLETFRRLTGAVDPRGHRSYWFEATVGAGLPVIRTIRELVETGDRILRIDAVLSGTLNYLCEAHAQGRPFDVALMSAEGLGLTEPDPRQDLLCADVARKAMILGRLAGMPLEARGDLRIQPLLTQAEATGPLTSAGAPWPRAWPESACEYVVSIIPRDGAVIGRLQSRRENRPPLLGAENRFAITTERASDPPILIRGPGAGHEVTAAALFGDLLRSIARL